MMRFSLFLLFILNTLAHLIAQPIPRTEVDKMVHTIADHIRENYVLPEKGQQIATAFLNDLKEGRFYGATSLKKLDSTLTKSLREASNDYHLYTWNNPEIVRSLQAETQEAEEGEALNFFNNQQAYDSNFGFERVDILPENIGYIKLSQINISDLSLRKLYASMALVANTRALIIDLRNNGGGGSTVGPVLETFFFEKQVDLLEFRSRKGQTEMSQTVGWLLEERYLKPLYVLVNKGTASAAEAFAFALHSHGRCEIVGEASSGGAYMNTYFPVNEDFVVAISTAAPFLPETNESWEGTGVQPDHNSGKEDALEKALEIIHNALQKP